jgi:fimbrial chaperone protein
MRLTALSKALLRGAFWFVLGTLAPVEAQGGAFQVFPIRLEFTADKTVSALTIRNDGEGPTVIQGEAVAWAHSNGEDSYVPSRDVLVFPPIVTIAPGAEQIVRVALRRDADPQRELSYRIYLREIPPRPVPGFRGLQVILRVGIPLFVAPRGPQSSELAWRASLQSQGTIGISARNVGNTHAQIASFTILRGGDAEPIARQTEMTYVLNGQFRKWLFRTQAKGLTAASKLHLKAQINGEEVDTELAFGTMEP